MSPRSYLDHNAGSPIRPAVADAMVAALGRAGNPSSIHAEGRAARGLIEHARAAVAALVGAAPEGVVFTSGGTEANNLALCSGLAAGARLLASATEHPAIREGHGAPADSVTDLPIGPDGVADLGALAAALAAGRGPVLVALQFANNETGVIQPVRATSDLVRQAGGLLHSDAVQAAGRIPVDLAALGVDSLALSAHKLGGPSGVGALVLAPGREIARRLVGGGGQESGRRGGTENLSGIVGFGVAAEIALRDLAAESVRLGGLRDAFERALRRVATDVVIFGAAADRLPNTVAFAIPGLRAESALIGLDLAGIAVSSGAACSSGRVRLSPVLAAMGVPTDLAVGAIRVSFGWNSDARDVVRVADALETQVRRLYQRRIERAA